MYVMIKFNVKIFIYETKLYHMIIMDAIVGQFGPKSM